jgi:hypothetical protein
MAESRLAVVCFPDVDLHIIPFEPNASLPGRAAMQRLTNEQKQALAELGINRKDYRRFLSGTLVAFEFATESSPAIALARKDGIRVSCGILLLNDPGGGVKTLARFRSMSRAVAEAFHATELELFGVAVTNSKVRQMLSRQAFAVRTIPCQDALGGGELEIIARVFPVQPW